jgi:hypothetical protein
MDPKDIRNLQEAYLEVYDNIMEKEDSPYEKASDAALDRTYGYGRASGDKRSFGRAANRASAAAMLRRLRRDRDEGRTTSRESGADAVHQGWAHTARTSSDQTPEKKKRRAKLADTPYSQLPNDEQEKDRVSADAVRALYNRNNTQKEQVDLYDIILSHLIDEGYAETVENAESIMVNMSEDWRQSIVEDIAGNQYTSNPIGNIIKTGAGLVKRVLNGTGPVKRDEPLWDGPETPTKPPVPTGGPKLRDEPLWDGPNKWETPTKPPVPKGGPKLRDEPLF